MGYNDGSGKTAPMNDRLDVKVGSLAEFAENLGLDVKEYKDNLTRWMDPGRPNSPSHPEISMGGKDDWPGHSVRTRNEKAFADMSQLAFKIQLGLAALKDAAAGMAKAYEGEDDYSKVGLDAVDFAFTPPKPAGGDPAADPIANRKTWTVIYDVNGKPIGFDKNADGKISEDEKIAESTEKAPEQDPNRYKQPGMDDHKSRNPYENPVVADHEVVGDSNSNLVQIVEVPYNGPGGTTTNPNTTMA